MARQKKELGYAMTLNEIAAIEGVTGERIRQIEATAMKKLRQAGITAKALMSFAVDTDGRSYARSSSRTVSDGGNS